MVKKKPKILVQGRITQKASEKKDNYAIRHNLKTDTEILEHVFSHIERLLDLEQSTSKQVIPQVKTSEQNLPISNEEDDDYFDCTKLCKRQKTCNRVGRNMISEIEEIGCYITSFPYEYKDHRVCKFMLFETHPHDVKNPLPKCTAKQSLVPIQLPKDRIMRNPQICWTCYMTRKRAKEQKEMKARVQAEKKYGSTKRVNWGDAEGSPDLWRLGDR